jgi:hypothetical protein
MLSDVDVADNERRCALALDRSGPNLRIAIGIAAAFLARALARFEHGHAVGFRGADALQKLEAARRAIGEVLRRRAG